MSRPDRFDNEVRVGNAGKLLAGQSVMRFADGNQDSLGRHQWVQPADRILNQSGWAQEWNEGLRQLAGTQRPETFAPTSGHDHCIDCLHSSV